MPTVTGRFGELHNIEASTTPNLFNNTTAVRITQQLTARKLAGHVVVTDEMLADRDILALALEAMFDRQFRPWRFPDRNPMPRFVLFPRLDAIARRIKRKGSIWPRRERG